MALQFVGQTTGSDTSNGYTISLNGTLTGGIASSPSPGDLVIVWSAFGNTAASAPAVTGNNNGAYTDVHTALHVNDTWDTEFSTEYKVQGSTVDTSLTITRTTNAAYGGATVVQVWRGVAQANPIASSNTATITNASRVTFGAVTPTIAGSVIVAGAAGTQGTTGSAFTGPANMTSANTLFSNGTTSDIGVLSSYFTGWTSGSFTPNTITGGTTSTSSSGASSTVVINPAPIHDTDGILTGPGSSIVGSANHVALFVTHATSGSLVGQGSLISGSASRVHVFSSSGALTGQGSVLSGSALRFAVHLTSGVLTGQGSSVVGSASISRVHATSGTLAGQTGSISGTASRVHVFGTSGTLTGPGSSVVGSASNKSIGFANLSATASKITVGTRIAVFTAYRETEEANARITEAGIFRVTENFEEGVSHLTAEGYCISTSIVKQFASVALTASGTLDETSIKYKLAASLVAGNSSLAVVPNFIRGGVVSLQATGTKLSVGFNIQFAYSVLNASGSLAGVSGLIKYGQTESGLITYERATQNDDIRITEGGDTRITNEAIANVIDSSLVVQGDRGIWTSTGYIKEGAVWKEISHIYVKYNGNWVTPEKMYKNENNVWKLIYKG